MCKAGIRSEVAVRGVEKGSFEIAADLDYGVRGFGSCWPGSSEGGMQKFRTRTHLRASVGQPGSNQLPSGIL